MDTPILDWKALADERAWSALLLGNGASIALHPGFNYASLLAVAEERGFLGRSLEVFRALGTSDFEHVLLALWHAQLVNTALGKPSPEIERSHADARAALIQAVHAVHCAPEVAAPALPRIGRFAQRFSTIVTFNYDLTLYWALLDANTRLGAGWFKDGFTGTDHQLDRAWQRLRIPHGVAAGSTLFFYGHGSLVLGRDFLGRETKIVSPVGGELLHSIFDRWDEGGVVPIFVSEGTSADKLRAIRRSNYLSIVHDDVLTNLGDAVVAYGFSFAPNDAHVLDAMARNPPGELAVSVFTGQPPARQQAFCHEVQAAIVRTLPHTRVRFFGHSSPGCWNNPGEYHLPPARL